ARVRGGGLERESEEPLELGPPGVRLVESGRERRALGGKERLGIEHVLAGRPSGLELIAPDTEILLRLLDPDARGLRRREALLDRPLRRAHPRLELAQRAVEGDPVAVGGDAGLADLGRPPRVGAEVPAEADEARADALRL